MGQTAAALGMPTDYEFEGQTYKISPWTFKIQGQFELYLEEQAVQAARRMRPFLTDEEYKETLAEVRRDIGAGLYAFGSELVQKAIWTRVHFRKLLHLCLLPNHPDAKFDLATRMVDAALEEVHEKMAEVNTDPSGAAPTTPVTPAILPVADAASPS